MSTEIIRENAAVEEEQQAYMYTYDGESARFAEKMRQIDDMGNAEKVKLGKRLIEEGPYLNEWDYCGENMEVTLRYYETGEAKIAFEEALDALERAQEYLDWCEEDDEEDEEDEEDEGGEDDIAEARRALDEAERNAANAAVELADAIVGNWLEVIGDYGPIDWDDNCDPDAFINHCAEYRDDIDYDCARAWMSEEGLFEYLKREYLEDHDWKEEWLCDWDEETEIDREKFLDDNYTPTDEEVEAGFYEARDRVKEEAEESQEALMEEAEEYANQKYDKVELPIDVEDEKYRRVYRYFHDYAYELLRI